MNSIKSIFIYQGHTLKQEGVIGTYQTDAINRLFEIIKFHNPHLEISYVFGEHLIESITNVALDALSSSLLVIPAGESSTLDAVFSTDEIITIQDSTKKGLNLFVTCGSAYWLAKKRLWGTGKNPSEKQSKIGIFPGTAIGPLSHRFLHETVKIHRNKRELQVLLSGGGSFVYSSEDANNHHIQVLANYDTEDLKKFGQDATLNSAIVACTYGKGKAILSMIHLEYGAEDIDVTAMTRAFPERKENWQQIKTTLASEHERIAFISDILTGVFR